MARYRKKEYSLSVRKHANATVWYYSVYKNNKRITKSTGIGYTREKDKIKSRHEAEAYCDELLRCGRLKENKITLGKYIENTNFWDWQKSSFIRNIIARSPKDRPGITEGYCLKGAQVTRDYILPVHGWKAIESITPFDCEQLLFSWKDAGATHKTANNRKSIYSTILGEYERTVKMINPKADYFNPWRVISSLSVEKNNYGGLSIAEVQKIISPEGIDFSRERERIYYMASKLAFFTGLRIGEICGLYTDDVRDVCQKTGSGEVRMSYLNVSHQWHSRLKKRTFVKDKEVRCIPISAELRDELEIYLIKQNCFLFSFHPRQKTPITDNRLRDWFYKRMEAVEIQDREQRNIVFHSTRRFFNTLLRRARVADSTIQRFTGHNSVDMTEHYTDYLPEDLQEISKAQSRFIEGNKL